MEPSNTIVGQEDGQRWLSNVDYLDGESLLLFIPVHLVTEYQPVHVWGFRVFASESPWVRCMTPTGRHVASMVRYVQRKDGLPVAFWNECAMPLVE
jgi:hypothetical protein